MPISTSKYNQWKKLIDVGSFVEFSCLDGWKLEGPSMKECDEKGTWMPDAEVKCIEIL